MRMKSLVFSLALLAAQPSVAAGADTLATVVSDTTEATRYEQRVDRYRRHWAVLVPTQTVMQYAGNMGFLSVGVGWNYGRGKKWETHLLFGYLPKFDSRRAKLTMTLKENFIPWRIDYAHGWQLEPLSCGLYLNTVFGREFWSNQPDRYPDHYYPLLKTKLRANIFLGQRITKLVPRNRRKFVKSVTLFYEVSTCDLYIRSMVQDKEVSLWDILGLSIGVKTQVF